MAKKTSVEDIIIETKGYCASATPSLHLLPFAFKNYNGPAKVSTYFSPEEIPKSDDNPAYLRGFFRGRELRGAKIEVPLGYTGVVIRELESKEEHYDSDEEGNDEGMFII
jgi:hypothetical protein